MKNLPINQIVCGDTLKTLKGFPARSISMVMTSPPYYGLRDYKVEGQIRLEKTPQKYIEKFRRIMLEIKRVLRKDGTIWWNVGDTYGSSSKGSGGDGLMGDGTYARLKKRAGFESVNFQMDVPPKCLLMMPERFAFMMIDIGFTLRNKIIWHKPNPTPSSVKDRFNTTWAYVYLFSKSRKYYFDLDAVRKPHKDTKTPKYDLNNKPKTKTVGGVLQKGRYRHKEVKGKGGIYGYERRFNNPLGKNPAGIVLDPFCGSGTTCVVAKKLGVNFIGIDLKKEYCEMARQRLRKVRKGEGIKKPKKRTVGKKLKISELKKLKPLDSYIK